MGGEGEWRLELKAQLILRSLRRSVLGVWEWRRVGAEKEAELFTAIFFLFEECVKRSDGLESCHVKRPSKILGSGV